jgi:hypothetical protein
MGERLVTATEYGPEAVDLELSRELCEKVRGQDKACFYNAWSALPFAPEGSYYVEGYGSGILASMHGWIETPEGTIIDPTPCFHDKNEKREWKTTYFPAKRWTLVELCADTVEIGELPFNSDEFGQSFKLVEYREAFRRATYHSYGPEGGAMMLQNLNKHFPDDEGAQ